MLITWLTKLGEEVEVLRRWLEGQAQQTSPQAPASPNVVLDGGLSDMLHRWQRKRLQAFGVQTNALIFLEGNPDRGGLLQVNTQTVELSPTEWAFLWIRAAEMRRHQGILHPQPGLGFLTKEVLAARAQALTRHLRTTFRPSPPSVKTYVGRLRRKLEAHLGMGGLIETQLRLGGWRLSTLPEHIALSWEEPGG